MSELQTTVNDAVKPSFTDIWRPSDFSAIELQRASDVTIEYPRHWHDEFYLSATVAGESHLDCAGTSFCVPQRQLVVVPPGEVHANRKVGCTARTIFLDFKALQDVVEHFVERNLPALHFRSAVIDNEGTTNSFLQMHRSLEGPRFELEQETSLSQFLYRFVAQHSVAMVAASRESNEDCAIQRAKKYLEEHYAERILLRDLVQVTRISPYHFNRSFCRKVGMPPHAYQLQLRIAQAKRFLRSGHSVSDTAFLVGFFDQSHFVHSFKRSEGITPSQYAFLSKNLQAGKVCTHYSGRNLSR